MADNPNDFKSKQTGTITDRNQLIVGNTYRVSDTYYPNGNDKPNTGVIKKGDVVKLTRKSGIDWECFCYIDVVQKGYLNINNRLESQAGYGVPFRALSPFINLNKLIDKLKKYNKDENNKNN